MVDSSPSIQAAISMLNLHDAAADQREASRMDSIPNEILAKIFEAAHTVWYYGEPPDRRPTGAALAAETVIPQVCSLWRDLARSVPKLWSTFYLHRTDHYLRKGECERLLLYLALSKNEDIDLVFDMIGIYGHPAVMELLSLIPPQLGRLRRLVIHADPNNAISSFHKQLTGVAAPRLEHLEICTGLYHNIAQEGFDDLPNWDPRILTEGPCAISYLKLDSSAAGRFRPPIDNLVHFSVHPGLAPDIELSLLWHCYEQILCLPFIESVSLWDCVIASPSSSGTQMRKIEAKRLKHVRIGKISSDAPPVLQSDSTLRYLLSFVSAPQLESLTIHYHPDSAYEVYPIAQAVGEVALEKPFPSLKALYLIDIYIASSADWHLLRHLATKTDSITHLSISETAAPRGMAHATDLSIVHIFSPHIVDVPPSDMLPFWPRVQTLELNLPFYDRYRSEWRLPGSLLKVGERYWKDLSAVRYPPKVFENDSVVKSRAGAADGNIKLEPLIRVLPSWPPGYDLPSMIQTDEFQVEVV